MPRSLRLTQPPNRIVTAAIGLLTQEQVGQIDAIWIGLLQETGQPDVRWNWAYKLRLAVNDDRYDAYQYLRQNEEGHLP